MIANNSCENVHIVLSNISFIYDPVQLNNNLLECRTVGVFATSIGSKTVGSTSTYVLDVDNVKTVDSDDEYDTDTDDGTTTTELDHALLDDMDIDLYALISSMGSTTVSKTTGVSANHLSKVWRIDTKTAENTLCVMNQLLRQFG